MQFEDRTTIVDPLTGRERPVVGVSVAYASVVGTGGWALALPVHWKVLATIRSIPDTVDEFTGYRIGLDLFAWDAPGLENVKTFHSDGKAIVRNVTLPAEYSHVFVPDTAQLALSAPMRAWINAFDPDNTAGRCAAAGRERAQRDVGRRYLAQHQEALVPRGAAFAARAAPGSASRAIVLARGQP